MPMQIKSRGSLKEGNAIQQFFDSMTEISNTLNTSIQSGNLPFNESLNDNSYGNFLGQIDVSFCAADGFFVVCLKRYCNKKGSPSWV